MDTIISLVTPDIAEHAKVFTDNQRAYAEKWGMRYVLFEDKIWESEVASYSKVPAIAKTILEMNYHDILIFLDADIGITNFTTDLRKVILNAGDCFLAGYAHFHWRSWRHICDAILIMTKSFRLEIFMEKWIDRCLNGSPIIIPGRRTRIIDVPHEQFLFDEMIRELDFDGIHAATAQEVGCFSEEIWTDGCAWEKGFPTVHCGGAQATWERRAQVFRDIYEPQIVY